MGNLINILINISDSDIHGDLYTRETAYILQRGGLGINNDERPRAL